MANVLPMDLLTYISDMSRRVALAEACSTSPDYLWQIATKWRGKRPSPDLAALIERETERLGPEKVAKEPMIFGTAQVTGNSAVKAARSQIRALVDLRMNKRALRQKFGFRTDAHLAKVLGVGVEVIESWPEGENVPAALVGAVQKLLGHEEQPAQQSRPQDPDEDRIVRLEVA